MTLLSEHLHNARQALFVGRAAERALFQTALTEQEPPFRVLYVYGLGGVGKTMLLREFAALCADNGAHATLIDARNIDPSPEGFLNALSQSQGLDATESIARLMAGRDGRHVILVDTCELLAPLENWLREEFLPQLPDPVFVVMAGRRAPSRDWQIDAGWQSLLRTIALRNLNPEESHGYLLHRKVPQHQHAAILSFTHGHPLALSLVADLFAQHRFDAQNNTLFVPEGVPDTVKVLVEHLVQEVPSSRHRAAIEVCALVRLTTESSLHEMLPEHDDSQSSAHDLFAWLRTLSFIEVGTSGIFPHDLAREAIITDLRWRDPQWHSELHQRARNYYTSRLQQTSEREQQNVLFDYIFLHRGNPVVKPFLEWQEHGSLIPSAARASDVATLLGLVEKHEGSESAQIAAHWFKRQLQKVVVIRDNTGHLNGFLAPIELRDATPEDLQIDPGAQAAAEYLHRHAPLRADESALLYRFWMADDTYQAVSPTQSLIFVKIVQQYLTSAGLAFTFLTCADPDFWAPIFTYGDAIHIEEADFEVAGRHYGTYGHDWRVVPPIAWLERMAEQETASPFENAAPPAPIEQMVVLSEPEFVAAVQSALRHFLRPAELRNNPLLRSRLVMEANGASGNEKKVEALQQIVRSACEELQQSPRTTKFYWPLYHTYLHPSASQEQAAELLDLPFSTFRRHLKEGISRVLETLWQQETHVE